MKLVSVFLVLAVVAGFKTCAGLKILSVFPAISKSHCVLGDALLRGLARKGHHVTSVTTFPNKKPFPNITEIKMTNVDPKKFLDGIMAKGGFFKFEGKNKLVGLYFMVNSFKHATETAINDPSIQNLNQQFDVIIAPLFFNEGLLVYLSNKFNAPVIALATSGTSTVSGYLVGNPSNPSYMPEVLYPFTDRLTFTERVWNTIAHVFIRMLIENTQLPNEERVVKKYIPGAKDIHTEMKKIALVLSNSHLSLSNPQPLTPALVEIGGFHVEPPKPLPKDLQTILDNSKNGVIFFSLGTNIKSHEVPAEMKQAIVETFGKIKETVLWKWDEETIPRLSKNVHLSSWLPQSDILAHPNVKLFITHGGLLSTIEAVVRGVPVIGIPIFADQKRNIQNVVASGVAIELDYANITTESFTWALNEILTNPTYRDNVQHRSKIINDRIVSPMDEAVYWVEYVARHKGAKHLQTAILDLSFYQYLLLDVVAFLGAILLGVLFLIYVVVKIIVKGLRRLISKKTKKE